MAQATVRRLQLRGLVPRGLGPEPAVALERALGDPFAAALAEAFAALADADPGALWVLRRLDVRLAVPASEPDPAAQARRVAAGVARAVQRAVADGPSAGAVRFASRPRYVADYLLARTAGHGHSWVFERFAAIAPLPVADALPAAARIGDVDLLDVVSELAAAGGWVRLLAASGEAELRRLSDTLQRSCGGARPAPELLQAVAGARRRQWRRQTLLGPGAGPSGARTRLELLAELAPAVAVTPALIAAIWRIAPAGPGPSEETEAEAGRTLGTPERRARSSPAAESREELRDDDPGCEPQPVFASAGAGSLLLLPDLAELLAEDEELAAASPAAAMIRAVVLAGALGAPVEADDPAVRLAAGRNRPPQPQEWAACCDGPLTAWAHRLAADPVRGWQHPDDARFAASAFAVHPGLGVGAVALLRRFSRHLPGFGEARAEYLIPQVIPRGGVVRVAGDVIEAVLPTGPLHVLLALGGLDAFRFGAPWLPGRVVVTHEVAP